MIEYIEMFASIKANALLIEYEDKFPFDKHKELRHPEYCLNTEKLTRLKQAAYDNFIDIIPLQQAFGHLEYVLKHKSYHELRETNDSAGEICPSKKSSFDLVTGLLDEIISSHPESEYMHLGCDEVRILCKCEDCQRSYGQSEEKTLLELTFYSLISPRMSV